MSKKKRPKVGDHIWMLWIAYTKRALMICHGLTNGWEDGVYTTEERAVGMSETAKANDPDILNVTVHKLEVVK